jgi:hypothetical protein
MSEFQKEISKIEIDPNRLSEFLKTPLPDFALNALTKHGFNQPSSEASHPLDKHNLQPSSGQNRCKLAEHLSAIAKHCNSDGGRIWDRRTSIVYSGEHDSESTQRSAASN